MIRPARELRSGDRIDLVALEALTCFPLLTEAERAAARGAPAVVCGPVYETLPGYEDGVGFDVVLAGDRMVEICVEATLPVVVWPDDAAPAAPGRLDDAGGWCVVPTGGGCSALEVRDVSTDGGSWEITDGDADVEFSVTGWAAVTYVYRGELSESIAVPLIDSWPGELIEAMRSTRAALVTEVQ